MHPSRQHPTRAPLATTCRRHRWVAVATAPRAITEEPHGQQSWALTDPGAVPFTAVHGDRVSAIREPPGSGTAAPSVSEPGMVNAVSNVVSPGKKRGCGAGPQEQRNPRKHRVLKYRYRDSKPALRSDVGLFYLQICWFLARREPLLRGSKPPSIGVDCGATVAQQAPRDCSCPEGVVSPTGR